MRKQKSLELHQLEKSRETYLKSVRNLRYQVPDIYLAWDVANDLCKILEKLETQAGIKKTDWGENDLPPI